MAMNDWNKNGKYDTADSYMDYRLANSSRTSGPSSDWWKTVLLAIVFGVCPALGLVILFVMWLFD